MYAIPPFKPGVEVDPTGRYLCPLCKVQRAGDVADTGWVICPLVKNRMICLGSCLEYQKAARSLGEGIVEHFSELPHDEIPYNMEEARRICLRHQLQVIDELLDEGTPDAVELTLLRKTVVKAMAQGESDA